MLVDPTLVSEIKWRYEQDFHDALSAFSQHVSCLTFVARTEPPAIPMLEWLAIVNEYLQQSSIHPAIDLNEDTCHVTCCGRRQERHDVGELIRLT